MNIKCNKCGTIYGEDFSERFVKTSLKKCPVCGSVDVVKAGKREKTSKREFKKAII